MNYPAGKIIKGKYRILSELGEGGFGTVFKAEDISLERIVALKILKRNLGFNDEDVARIKIEAQLLARLRHPNIVTVYSFEMLDDIPVLAMEYIEGKTLAMRINEGSIDEQCFTDVVFQVCAGLQYAHDNKVVHRDLSPRNILLVEEGSKTIAKIIDFGLSKMLNSDADGGLDKTTLTATGFLVGNPNYMSPEVCIGAKADSLSDIYSFGCILYEMLCGHSMFSATDSVAILYKQQHEYAAEPELTWDAQGNEALYQNLALLCLQKDKNRRPQSASVIIDCLNNPQIMQKHLSHAAHWQSSRFKDHTGMRAFALLACFALVAVVAAGIGLTTKKADVKQVQLGPQQVKHIEASSTSACLLKVRNLLSNLPDDEQVRIEKVILSEKDLDQLLNSKRSMEPNLKYIAYLYKANLLSQQLVSREQIIAAYKRCVPYSLTSKGEDTTQTATALYFVALYLENHDEAYKAARRAIAAYEQSECKAIEIPKEYRIALNTVTVVEISSLISRLADERGNQKEALRWLQFGVEKANPDPNWHWRIVCAEAGYLKKLGRTAQAEASLNKLIETLCESALFDPQNPVYELSASSSINTMKMLGDWCRDNKFPDIAKKVYSRTIELIDQTGLNKELRAEVAGKL